MKTKLMIFFFGELSCGLRSQAGQTGYLHDRWGLVFAASCRDGHRRAGGYC